MKPRALSCGSLVRSSPVCTTPAGHAGFLQLIATARRRLASCVQRAMIAFERRRGFSSRSALVLKRGSCADSPPTNLGQRRPLLLRFPRRSRTSDLRLCTDSNHAAPRQSDALPIGSGFLPRRRRFHQIGADHERRRFGLRQVDERALLLPIAMKHAGNNNDRAQHAGNIIRKNRLRADRRIGTPG